MADKQNYPLCRLKLLVEKFGPTILEPTNLNSIILIYLIFGELFADNKIRNLRFLLVLSCFIVVENCL